MIEEILLLGKIVGISFIIASRFDSIRRIIPKDLQDTFPSWLTFHMDEDIYPPFRDVHDTWKTLPCGDMLYKAPEHRSIRLHTPFVSDKEFKSVLSFLKKK